MAIIPRPRGGTELAHDLAALRAIGLDVLVSLLAVHEQDELGLACESAEAEAAGIRFAGYPILEAGVPDDPVSFAALVESLGCALVAGRTVGIHCRMGIGRSGLLAASLLVRAGLTPEAAWRAIEQARGRPVPDTEQQRQYPARFTRADRSTGRDAAH
jgi:protein-tyrosine phosphatase